MIGAALPASSSNEHFIISLVVTTVLSSGVIGTVIRFSGKLISRFEAVEEGLKDNTQGLAEVRDDVTSLKKDHSKLRKKVKTMQIAATREVLLQVAERKRILDREANRERNGHT